MWPFVFIAAGLAVLIYGIGLVRDARAAAGWPTVEGKVTAAEPEVIAREKDRRTYALKVAYTYTVAGKMFEGTRVTLVPRNYTILSGAQAVLERYPVNRVVRVFHDPKDPANCILDPGSVGNEWAYPIAGVIFIAVGAMMWRER